MSLYTFVSRPKRSMSPGHFIPTINLKSNSKNFYKQLKTSWSVWWIHFYTLFSVHAYQFNKHCIECVFIICIMLITKICRCYFFFQNFMPKEIKKFFFYLINVLPSMFSLFLLIYSSVLKYCSFSVVFVLKILFTNTESADRSLTIHVSFISFAVTSCMTVLIPFPVCVFCMLGFQIFII